MAIKKRYTADDPTFKSDEALAAERLAERAADSRGVFDPGKDPYEGSYISYLVGDRTTSLRVSQELGHAGYFPKPNEMRVQDLLANIRMAFPSADNVEVTYRNRIRSPLTGIRAFCVQCKYWRPGEVRKCQEMSCPLWPFRMGRNRFRGASA